MSDVCVSVCLSVSNLKGLHENFTTDVSVDREEQIKLWKSSASESGSKNVLKVS